MAPTRDTCWPDSAASMGTASQRAQLTLPRGLSCSFCHFWGSLPGHDLGAFWVPALPPTCPRKQGLPKSHLHPYPVSGSCLTPERARENSVSSTIPASLDRREMLLCLFSHFSAFSNFPDTARVSWGRETVRQQGGARHPWARLGRGAGERLPPGFTEGTLRSLGVPSLYAELRAPPRGPPASFYSRCDSYINLYLMGRSAIGHGAIPV